MDFSQLLQDLAKRQDRESRVICLWDLSTFISLPYLDGRYQLDSNLVENVIHSLALGRRNYLFCGNHDAAENAAVMYSLLGCCKAADVDPRG